MLALIAPLSYWLVGGQHTIHRALRAQVLALVEQGGDHLSGRAVDEAWAGEQVENPLAQRILSGTFGPGDVIEVSASGEGLSFSKGDAAEAA